MQEINSLIGGFAVALTWFNLMLMLAGVSLGVLIGVLFARIMSEFVLIMFRINEHLGAIRQRGQM